MQLKTGQTIMGEQVCSPEAKLILFKGFHGSETFFISYQILLDV